MTAQPQDRTNGYPDGPPNRGRVGRRSPVAAVRLIAIVSLAGVVAARSAAEAPPRVVPASAETVRPAASSSPAGPAVGRWTFHARSPVTIESPIIYLRDVLRPQDPDFAPWQRIGRSPLGLVPTDGTPTRIRRQRLADAIRGMEATTAVVEIHGPDSIEIAYRPGGNTPGQSRPPTATTAAGTAASIGAAVATGPAGSASGPVKLASGPVTLASGPGTSGPGPTGSPPVTPPPHPAGSGDATWEVDRERVEGKGAEIDPATRRRLAHWLQTWLDRHEQVAGRFQAEMIHEQPGWIDLRDARRLSAVRFDEATSAGVQRVHVEAVAASGNVTSEIAVRLVPYPEAVASRMTLPRGHRITAVDLTAIPMAPEHWREDFVTDPEGLIGKEVLTALRPGQPIRAGDARRPLLVKRGDLVEVRVVGGGITVSTNGRSLGEGSEHELVQVETLDPKRKVVARVLAPGSVEIISRVPGVR